MSKALTNIEIMNYIKKDAYGVKNFIGVYPRDKLPIIFEYPCALVINSDPSSKPGEHWLALHFNKEKSCEFFDSYGNQPEYYGLEHYISRYSNSCEYNETRLQDWGSSSCGYYCIFFILFKNRSFSLKEIVSLFSKHDFNSNYFLVEHIIYD